VLVVTLPAALVNEFDKDSAIFLYVLWVFISYQVPERVR
jgi:hypothetical protein